MDSIRIHPADNVEVLLKPCGDVPAGHKLALRNIRAGEKIVKYGFPIGTAKEAAKEVAKDIKTIQLSEREKRIVSNIGN